MKATANKGWVFVGWRQGEVRSKKEEGRSEEEGKSEDDFVAKTQSLVVDRTAKPGKDTKTSTTLTNVTESMTFFAEFVTVEADRGSIAAGLNGVRLEDTAASSKPPCQTNVTAGVALQWPIAADALSQTTVKVAGLPSGLKFTAKDIMKKGSKTEVEVPANTIYGTPTAASKVDKKKGVVPSNVKITVTTAGKSSVTYLVKLTVDPLPAWAVGSFDGPVDGDGGTVALTIATSGKISGKILEGGRTWTLSASNFSRVERADRVEESDVLYATVIGKVGKEIVTNEVAVRRDGDIAPYQGVVSGVMVGEPSLSWTAWQNLWKRADTKASQPVFKKSIVVDYLFGVSGDKNNTVKITFKKDGAVSFSGKKGGVSVSGSSQVVTTEDGWQVTLYVPPKATAKPSFEGWCETLPVSLEVNDQNIVTAAELGEYRLDKVQLWAGGPYWATTNIGAKRPEDWGYYFWWGDTVGYKRENNKWVASDGSVSGFSFDTENAYYTYFKDAAALQSEGWITADGVLAPEHDAAQAHWGDAWRMPTYQELQGLVDNCDWTLSAKNGVYGYEVRGRGDYVYASIFLPGAGYGKETGLVNEADIFSYGDYWSSVPGSDHVARILIFRKNDHSAYYTCSRSRGLPIRPVQDAE